MGENSNHKQEGSVSLHMNSVSFNAQDHYELSQLKYKKGETCVFSNTNDDLKSEDMKNEKNILDFPGPIKCQQDVESENMYNNHKVNRVDSFTMEDRHLDDLQKRKWTMNSQAKSKVKGSAFSRDSFYHTHQEGKKSGESQLIHAQNSSCDKEKEPRRLMKAINLLVNVKSFYRLLTKNSRIFGKLTREQHYLINDSTSYYNGFQDAKGYQLLQKIPSLKKIISALDRVLTSLINTIPMFQPYSYSKFLWDIFQALLILSVIFLFSLVIFFQMETTQFVLFFQGAFILFLFDIMFTFNTCILEKGNVIFDRKKAAVVYLKRNFVMDQIALVPLIVFFFNIRLSGIYSWAIYFQILMKLFVLQDIFSRLIYYLNYQKNMKNIIDLVKLVFIIGCVCHFFCLFWHGLAVYEINQGSTTTWLQSKNLQDADVFTRYVYSFYFLAVTMITVGYGDITPQTTYEVIFTTLTMFVTGFFYAFSLNRIGNIIDNIEMKDKTYKESMQIIHRFMREEKVPQKIRVQISNYLEYIYKESNEVLKNQERNIIDKLSKQLKYELIQDVQGKYLKDIPFIDKMNIKSKVVEIMEECLFSPGEYIFRQGDIDDCSIYYIVKGCVQMLYEYEERNKSQSLILFTLKKQQYFGDLSLILANVRTASAQASDFCRIYKIPREPLMEILKESDQDFENFQMIKEASIFKDSYKLSNIKCYICKKADHVSSKCPKTHLTISKQTLIHRENSSQPQLFRTQYKRSQYRFGSLMHNQQTIDALYQFADKEDNALELEQLEQNLHLSQDEAYLEECYQELYELEQQEMNGDDHKMEQLKQFNMNPEQIKEVGQEEEEDDINNKSSQNPQLPLVIDSERGGGSQGVNSNEQSDINSLLEVTSQTQRTQSHYQNKGKGKHQTPKSMHRNSTTKNNSQIQLLIPMSIDQQSNSFLQQSDQLTYNNQLNVKNSSSDNSSSSSSGQNTPSSQLQDEAVQELSQQISQFASPKMNIPKFKSNNTTSQPSFEFERKKSKTDASQVLGSKESALHQKSKELVPSQFNTLSQNASNATVNSGTLQQNNQNQLEIPVDSYINRQRKSKSLTQLKDYNFEKTNSNQSQDAHQNPPGGLNQLKRIKYQQTKKKMSDNKQSKLRRSQSFDQCSITQIMKQMDINNNNQPSSSFYQNTKQNTLVQKMRSFNNMKGPKEDTSLINHFHKQNSTSSCTSQNKMKSNFSNSQNPSLVSLGNNNEGNILNRQKSNQKGTDKGILRSNSKKITVMRQLKQQQQQQRMSQLLSPVQQYGLTQGQFFNFPNQNPAPIMKNQWNYLQQLNQYANSNAFLQLQNQDNPQNQLYQQSISQRVSQNNNIYNQPSTAATSNSNNVHNTYNNSQNSLSRLPHLAQLLSLSQNNRGRRSNIFANNALKQQIHDNLSRNRLSNSQQLGGIEQRSSFADQMKKGSQLDILQRDFTKKNNNKAENNSLLPSNINLLSPSHLIAHDEIGIKQQGDSSYLMLQTFDKFRIYKYYYPNYNMYLVVSNLKQNEALSITKYTKIRQKQVSRNTVYSKKHCRQNTNNNRLLASVKRSQETSKNKLKTIEN